MRATTKIKVKDVQDPELVHMFNQMVGNGTPDPAIVTPKYDGTMKNCRDICALLMKFVTHPVIMPLRNEFSAGFDDIVRFVEKSANELDSLTIKETKSKIISGKPLEDLNKDPELLNSYILSANSTYDLEELGRAYAGLKDSMFIKEIIMSLRLIRNAIKESTNVTCFDKSDESVISSIGSVPGIQVSLLNFSCLNFKGILCSRNFNPSIDKYIGTFISILHNKIKSVHQFITSPDVDPAQFAEILVRNIDKLRAHIPRCDLAFDELKKNVSLLRDNFGKYHHDFVVSRNKHMIIENFVIDVAKKSKDKKNSAVLSSQFKRIVAFYKDQHEKDGKKKDPRIDKFFDIMNKNFASLDSASATSSEVEPDSTQPCSEIDSESVSTPLPPPEHQNDKSDFLPDKYKNVRNKQGKKK